VLAVPVVWGSVPTTSKNHAIHPFATQKPSFA